MHKKTIFFLGLFFLFLIENVYATPPVTYMNEEIYAEYYYNGTLITRENRGYVEIDVMNVVDVLRNVFVRLNDTKNTNLETTTAYSAVAASPTSGTRTKLYLSTNVSNESIYYNFYGAPIVNLKLNYENLVGGKDLTSGKNTLNFSLQMNTTGLGTGENLSNSHVYVRANRDTSGINDSMDFIDATCSSGSVSLIDSDADGFTDTIRWDGDLVGTIVIYFTAEIYPGVNYPEDFLMVNTDSGQNLINHTTYDNKAVFTRIEILDTSSKGPVRQGVKIMGGGINWTVQGFLKNIAYDLEYYVYGWNLYNVADNASLQNTISSGTDKTLDAGSSVIDMPLDCYDSYTICTSVFDTGKNYGNEKVYYATNFNWSVLSAEYPVYYGSLIEEFDFPILYQIDIDIDQSINIIKNDKSSTVLKFIDRIDHLGHSQLKWGSLEINTTGFNGWDIQNLRIYYSNDTGTIQLNNYTITNNGNMITLFIPGSEVEKVLLNNEVSVEYELSRESDTSDRDFTFQLLVKATTLSGTPDIENITDLITVPGVPETKPSVGGGGIKRIFVDILKIDSNNRFLTNSILENNISFRIIDTGDKGLKEPKLLIYLPQDTEIDVFKTQVTLERNGKEEKLNVTIRYSGKKVINGESYSEYVIEKITSPTEIFELYDNDIINLDYRVNIPLGTTDLITRLYGYDYYEDSYIFEDDITKIRREYWDLKDLIIKEDEWENRKILVDQPVEWVKTIEVYNPNDKLVKGEYITKILGDRLNVRVMESFNGTTRQIDIDKEEKLSLGFFVNLNPKERKTYFVYLTTPPVLEVNRNIMLIEATNESAKFNTKITVSNFAKYLYEKVYLRFPANEIIDCNFDYIYVNNETEIIIPRINSGENKTIDLTYSEKPPILKIFTDQRDYSQSEGINLSLIVIQADKKGYVEVEIEGPQDSKQSMYSDLVSLTGKSEVRYFSIPAENYPEGDYTIYAYYKSDFRSILIAKEKFYVSGTSFQVLPVEIVFLLILLTVILVLRSVYIKKNIKEEISSMKDIGELRKRDLIKQKIEEIPKIKPGHEVAVKKSVKDEIESLGGSKIKKDDGKKKSVKDEIEELRKKLS